MKTTSLLTPLAILWAAPWTLFGLLVGLLCLARGGRMRRTGRVVEFFGPGPALFLRHFPLIAGCSAVTFGHTILARSQHDLDATRRHELVHVGQYERWGPLFVPAYLLCWLILWLAGKSPYHDNPFERQAYEKEKGGSGERALNPAEAHTKRGEGRRWKRLLCAVLAVACLAAAAAYVSFHVWQWAAVPGDAPIVGVSLDTIWHARAGISVTGYQVGFTRAGAKIRELRPGDAEPDEILDTIDALVLAGGGDVDPELYGGEPDAGELVDRDRDDFELALIRGALERNIPILGICRGIQILNVFQGGTLRNLRDEPAVNDVHGITLKSMKAHEVRIAADSRLARILGPGGRLANSFHAQAVGDVGEGLQVAAVAPDGVVEAVEMRDRPLVIATQWHPEVPPQQMPVFEALVAAAREYRRNVTVQGRFRGSRRRSVGD